MLTPPRGPIGLVLAGAAALGAYHVGVVRHLVERLGARFDVLSGTSAGAINVSALAAGADDPRAAVDRLEQGWRDLRLDHVLRPSAIELLSFLAELAGGPACLKRALIARGARGGLLDPAPIAALCATAADPDRVDAHLAAGHLHALAVAATRVRDGRAVGFYQARAAPRPGETTPLVPARVGADHVLASAAIPLLFPAIELAGELYCDGGLRQMVPLSPALHLGARRLVVVSSVSRPADVPAPAARGAVRSPLYLAGKALDALFADGPEGDLDRLEQVNRLLAAGVRRYGPGFPAELDGALVELGGVPLRPVQVVHLAPSRDLGALAAAYVSGPALATRCRGPASRALRVLASADPAHAGGLLAYLLFDGGFAAELIELGRSDARAREAELASLLGLGADAGSNRAGAAR